jgi:DNA-directed RNA polymerase specialized sigma subunit
MLGKFERVIIWMDRQEIAQSLMIEIPGSYGISSPKFGDKKRDANDMLQSGTLGAFLATARYSACESQTERKRFMYDLHDVIESLDDKTQSVLTTIKQKEAKQS